MKELKMIEESIYRIPLVLPKSLEPQRNELEQVLVAAQRRLRNFAVQNGWSDLVKESFADMAEIYSTQDKFIQAVIKITGVDPSTKFPKAFSACLEKRIFMSVSPEVYSQIYPEGIEDRSFEKLITHEMAHRLHVRILNGNEDAMGPIWFFEGFAIYAAGQFENYNLEPAKIWGIVRSTNRGSYKKYGTVFRYFLKKASIHELVQHAGDEYFLNWLQKIESR
ncbi:hypothetical protein KAW18_06540 [candidate division WOR-3 bacterium]|nr:hypothetical protein [candidate division WOR-3 bacterium]MCK4527011.1 hypothetical protein [candidate division WOR-3 bacterium]